MCVGHTHFFSNTLTYHDMVMQVLRLCGQIHSVGPWTAVREAVCEAVKNSVLVVRSAGLFEVCRAGCAGYMLYLVLEPIHLTQNTHVDLPLVTQASAKTTGGRELWELTLVVVEPYYPGIAQDTTTTPSSSSSSSSTATPTSTTTTSTTNKTSASDSKKPAGANGFQVVVADPVVAPPPTAT